VTKVQGLGQALFTAPLEFNRGVLDVVPDAMVIIDGSGVIRFANRQVSELFGHPHEHLIGKAVESLMPECFRSCHDEEQKDGEGGAPPRVGTALGLLGLRRDGTEFPVEISLSAITGDGTGAGLVAVAIRDAMERKRLEAELRTIRAARDAADRASLAKGRFLATASHDLRQPVQTLALLNGALRHCVDNAEAVEAVAQQERAIDAMSRLLSGLLDISKLESGAIKPDPSDFAVKAMFEELRDEFAGIASCKGLGFRVMPCKEEDSARSDRSLVGQVLRNLVSNALKYTREGWIALRCLHQAPDLLRLEVLDTGIGIAPDQLRYIYDEFYQVGGQQQVARTGYGLGLSIVQRIVTLLDVKLDVQSEVGRGSRFALILPASGVATHLAPQGRAQSVVHRTDVPAHILLVEDDDGVRSATRMLLRSEGYRVTATASLAQALESVRRDRYVDLLVTDYHLGDGKLGTEVIAAVREALGPQLKVVLVTGDTSSAIRMLAADRLMKIASKPVNSEELLSLLRTLLAIR
jgi:two-component system CheB/CheR fusion protein